MRKIRDTLVVIGLSAAIALAGCGAQGGGDQGGDAGSGTDSSTTSTQAATPTDGSGGGGGDGSGAAGAASTSVAELDGWWKVTSNKQTSSAGDIWNFSADELAKYQPRFDIPGALNVQKSDSSFFLNTLGGSMQGTVKETGTPNKFDFEMEYCSGFSQLSLSSGTTTATLQEDGTLVIVIDGSIDVSDNSEEAQKFTTTITCEKTNEYDEYDSMWDIVEAIHTTNRKVIDDTPLTSTNNSMPIASDDYVDVAMLGYGENDTEFLILLGLCNRTQRDLLANPDMTGKFTLNGQVPVSTLAYCSLPYNTEEAVAGQEPMEGRMMLVRFPKEAVNGTFTSVSGTIDITTPDWFPVDTIEFSYSIL